ncbi:helix-turn-helix domain-containing protein [Inquilinus sp. CAU 1745]|uniref:helix-turn-helix domain-containing protein n=1 Tax=Inquilinus sp. CAU 1745 TaxID=3140369 RepID=UPI00325B5815
MMEDAAETVLAGCAGRYREFAPSPGLRAHFRCAWLNEMPAGEAATMAVVPDGCVDIIWIGGRLEVAGPDVTAALSRPTPGGTIAGVRFRAGAAARWLGLTMTELVGRRVPLADIWGRRAAGLSDRIGEAGTAADRLTRLEREMEAFVPDESPPPEATAIFGALGGGEAGIPALRDRLEISERSLRRRCHESFGYGPKTLDRILRFQRFMTLVRSPDATLSGLAADSGYADQAHLSREVKRLSRLSPAAILRQTSFHRHHMDAGSGSGMTNQ